MTTTKKIFYVLFLFCSTFFYGQEIVTDRPDQTESSSTVGKNNFQLETGLTFEKYLSWLQKGIPNITKTNSGQRLWDKLADFPPCYIEHIKGILIHFYPSINKNINYREFIDTFDLPENLHFQIETITPKCFENNEKWSIFNVGM